MRLRNSLHFCLDNTSWQRRSSYPVWKSRHFTLSDKLCFQGLLCLTEAAGLALKVAVHLTNIRTGRLYITTNRSNLWAQSSRIIETQIIIKFITKNACKNIPVWKSKNFLDQEPVYRTTIFVNSDGLFRNRTASDYLRRLSEKEKGCVGTTQTPQNGRRPEKSNPTDAQTKRQGRPHAER